MVYNFPLILVCYLVENLSNRKTAFRNSRERENSNFRLTQNIEVCNFGRVFCSSVIKSLVKYRVKPLFLVMCYWQYIHTFKGGKKKFNYAQIH